ncbi:MAG: hypothetical protein HDT42_10865 [Ruminococcaceae bacterium]|nr:hypothetical protein [Oscillospiraceae bacterium]
MKLLKKIVPFFLALAVFASCFVTASAATAVTTATTEGSVVEVLTIHSAQRFSETQGGGSSSSSSGGDSGHSFLSFKNTYSDPIRIGGLSVGRGCEITFGTWDLSAHRGVWYNLESYCINHAGKMPNRISVSMNVTMSQVDIINFNIDLSSDHWSLIDNCSAFATLVWNSASKFSGPQVSAGAIPTPQGLYNSIKKMDGCQINRCVPDAKPCGYVEVIDGSKIFKSVSGDNIFVGKTANSISIIKNADFVVLDNPVAINEGADL